MSASFQVCLLVSGSVIERRVEANMKYSKEITIALHSKKISIVPNMGIYHCAFISKVKITISVKLLVPKDMQMKFFWYFSDL